MEAQDIEKIDQRKQIWIRMVCETMQNETRATKSEKWEPAAMLED